MVRVRALSSNNIEQTRSKSGIYRMVYSDGSLDRLEPDSTVDISSDADEVFELENPEHSQTDHELPEDYEYVHWADVLRCYGPNSESLHRRHTIRLNEMLTEFLCSSIATKLQLLPPVATELRIPDGVLLQAASAMSRTAESEPYGLSGAEIEVTLERRDHCVKLGRFKMDSNIASTFHLTLRLHEDLRLKPLHSLHRLACRLRPEKMKLPLYVHEQFKVDKNQLYRLSSSSLSELNS